MTPTHNRRDAERWLTHYGFIGSDYKLPRKGRALWITTPYSNEVWVITSLNHDAFVIESRQVNR